MHTDHQKLDNFIRAYKSSLHMASYFQTFSTDSALLLDLKVTIKTLHNKLSKHALLSISAAYG